MGEVKEEEKTLDAAGRPEGCSCLADNAPERAPKSRQASRSPSGVTDNS